MRRLTIEGMTCGHCVQAVSKALAKVPGVARVSEVSLERAEAVVEGSATAEALVAAVREAGYEARDAG
ncbi:CopZ family metallochaperone [Sorangium sp. So ce1097]|uniref:CopZ family metallochaperone n=1 Tax=Sorangium sp. So ce1097 TaxID=3133330 RepID=UPI003F63505E